MTDADLMTEAFQILEKWKARVPFYAAEYAELEKEIDAIAQRADQPEEIYAVIAEQLEWLRPPE